MFSNKKPRVKILFKSGNSIELEVEKFSIKKTGEKVTEINWTDTVPNMMFISLSEIEAIFELTKD